MLTMWLAVECAQYKINVHPSTTLRSFDGAQDRLGSGQGSGHRAVGLGVPQTYCFSQPLRGNPDLAKRVVRLIPKGRMAEPEEVVGAVLFIIKEAKHV
jgi:hypothetical protein